MGMDPFIKLYEASSKKDKALFINTLKVIKSGCNASEKDDANALLALCAWGDARGVRWLLEEFGSINISHVTYAGANALMWAAKGNHKECVELAISFCEPNWSGRHGVTALMYAAQKGADKAVALLLPHSNVDQVDARGKSALDHARQAGRSDVAAHILATKEMLELRNIAGSKSPARHHKRV